MIVAGLIDKQQRVSTSSWGAPEGRVSKDGLRLAAMLRDGASRLLSMRAGSRDLTAKMRSKASRSRCFSPKRSCT